MDVGPVCDPPGDLFGRKASDLQLVRVGLLAFPLRGEVDERWGRVHVQLQVQATGHFFKQEIQSDGSLSTGRGESIKCLFLLWTASCQYILLCIAVCPMHGCIYRIKHLSSNESDEFGRAMES